MKSGDIAIYIDPFGNEHNAIVGAFSADTKRASLLYVDPGKDHEFNSGAHENVIHRLVQIEHADAKSANPVNCWKEPEADIDYIAPRGAILAIPSNEKHKSID